MINELVAPKNHIPIPNDFEVQIAEYVQSRDEKSEIIKFLCEKKYHTKNTGLPARVLSHWADSGIIESSKSLEATGWREYSFLDLLWIDVVAELRTVGVSFEQIKKSYQTSHFLTNTKPSYLFEAGTTFALANEPIFLIFHKDGTCQLATREMIAIFLNVSISNLRTITLVSLNQIIERAFPDSINSIKANDLSNKFSDQETRVIYALRDPLVKEVTVIKKHGEIERCEIHKSADNPVDEERLKEMAERIVYGNIETSKLAGVKKIKIKESIKI